jgi:hypothetical protein
MACLIYARNSSGCTGKCDANCYDATSPFCDCICRGMNHGAGKQQATENTAKYAEEWIEMYKAERPGEKDLKLVVNKKEVYQMKLF